MSLELPPVATLRTPGGKREYNRCLFGAIAGEYAFITRALSFGRDAAWKRALIDALPRRDISCAVDLACGTGDLAMALAAKFPAADVVAVDLAEAMLAMARQRAAGRKIRFLARDMTATGLPDGMVDVVTGGYALRNAPDLDTALREIHRLLKPGGTAAFLDFSRSANASVSRATLAVLRAWGGFWGLVLHGNRSVYGYIADSLALFPDREALRRRISAMGFVSLRGRRFCGGIIELTVFAKPGPVP